MPSHAALVAGISSLAVLGFLTVVAIAWRPRKDKHDPGDGPLAA